jgi:hypothetical protein
MSCLDNVTREAWLKSEDISLSAKVFIYLSEANDVKLDKSYMKNRFSGIDVAAILADLQALVGLRLQNSQLNSYL